MEIKAKPKLDIVFKKLFTDVQNADLLIDFLSCVIDVPKNEIFDVVIIDNEVCYHCTHMDKCRKERTQKCF